MPRDKKKAWAVKGKDGELWLAHMRESEPVVEVIRGVNPRHMVYVEVEIKEIKKKPSIPTQQP